MSVIDEVIFEHRKNWVDIIRARYCNASKENDLKWEKIKDNLHKFELLEPILKQSEKLNGVAIISPLSMNPKFIYNSGLLTHDEFIVMIEQTKLPSDNIPEFLQHQLLEREAINEAKALAKKEAIENEKAISLASLRSEILKNTAESEQNIKQATDLVIDGLCKFDKQGYPVFFTSKVQARNSKLAKQAKNAGFTIFPALVLDGRYPKRETWTIGIKEGALTRSEKKGYGKNVATETISQIEVNFEQLFCSRSKEDILLQDMYTDFGKTNLEIRQIAFDVGLIESTKGFVDTFIDEMYERFAPQHIKEYWHKMRIAKHIAENVS